MAAIVDLTPDEIVAIIEERDRLRSALVRASAAYMYHVAVGAGILPTWPDLPDEARDGRSGHETYLAQAQEKGMEFWLREWEAL
jgi:hypothetical protein